MIGIGVVLLSCMSTLPAVSGQPSDDALFVDESRFKNVDVASLAAHRSLDLDCDSRVELAEIAGAQGMSLDEPKALERLETFDPDGDGFVTPEEIASGIRAGVSEQVAITMLTDVNDNGELTLREHALGFPDPDKTPDEEGVTARQRQAFAYLDVDGSGVVGREEVISRHEATFALIFWTRIVAHHMDRIDTNGDGRLTATELAIGLGFEDPSELPDAQRSWLDIVAPPGRDGEQTIVLSRFRIQLLQDRPASSRLRMEGPLRALLLPGCASNNDDNP